MNLEIYYDLVCPFCLIGKVKLDAAIASLAQAPTIRWTPLLLDVGIPAEGYGFQEYHTRKYGQRARPMQVQVENYGRQYGLAFDFLAQKRYPNSINGHRAIRYADLHGQATAMVDALLRAYFIGNQDIGDSAVLAAIAADLGLDGADLRTRLDTSWDYDAVITEHQRSVKRGARTVPSYLLNGSPVEDTNALVGLLQSARPPGGVSYAINAGQFQQPPR
jgi:predicted DsbA family dithiol-disulfide isomerase